MTHVGTFGNMTFGRPFAELPPTMGTGHQVRRVHGGRWGQVPDVAPLLDEVLSLLGGADVGDELLVLLPPVALAGLLECGTMVC